MGKQQKKCEQDRLTRSILLGLATGTSLLLACGGTASATTLSEYKAQLAANAAVEAGSGESKLLPEVDGYKSSGKLIHASAGGQVIIADTAATDIDDYRSTMTDSSAGHWNKKSNAVVDLTNDVFFSEGESSEILFENGKTKVTADRLYGQGSVDGKINNNGLANFSPGIIEIGDVDEYKEWKDENNPGALATLQLVGNSKFNTQGWTNDNGETINGKNFIVLRKNGILEAESAQIFNFGLGDGTVATTGGVRKDVNDAILFESGVVLLDDKKYNNAYLTDANIAVRLADGGDTVVEIKNDAKVVSIGTNGIKWDVDSIEAYKTFPKTQNKIGAEVYTFNKLIDLDDISAINYVKENTKKGIGNLNTGMTTHWLEIKDGTVAKPMTWGAGIETDGWDKLEIVQVAKDDNENMHVSYKRKEIDTTVDLTNVIFKIAPATGEHRTWNNGEENFEKNTVKFTNGTTLVKASNLYGDEKNTFDIGESKEDYKNVYGYTLLPAKLNLRGNEKFNSSWTMDAGDVISSKNFIVIKETGTLEANSAQIFNFGLGTDGTVATTGGVRKDANDAILFKSGVVLLDDKKYNISYLTDANTAVKVADGGNTVVEVKSDAEQVKLSSPGVTYNNYVYGVKSYPRDADGKPQRADLDDASILPVIKESTLGSGISMGADHIILLEDGAVAKSMTLTPGTVGAPAEQTGMLSIVHHPESEELYHFQTIDSDTDLTSVIFKTVPTSEGGTNITFVNGTTAVKASNLYGDEKNPILIGGRYEGDEETGESKLIPATLKLVGNEKFNSTWTTDAGDTVNGKNFIVINDKGTLEANSKQIFTVGLNKAGDIMSPQSIRVDADNAVYFKSGVLLLDDEKYNIAYLDEANKLVKDADGGTTEVEVKPTATRVEGNPNAVPDAEEEGTNTGGNENTGSDSIIRDIGDVPNDSWFGPVVSDKTDIVISDASDADSNVDKLNAQSLDLAEPTDGQANTITVNGKTFVLGSSTDGQELLTAGGKKPILPMIMKILNGATIRLGTGNAANNVYADITLGSGTANDNSTFNVAAGVKTINSLVANAGTNVIIAAQAMLNSPTVTFNGTTVKVDGILNITGAAVWGQDSIIYVGSASSAGKMIVSGDVSSVQGASIFLDPVWTDGTEITDASQLAINDTDITYNLVVGRNSVASIGTDDVTKAQQAFAETQLNWGEDETTAALYLAKPVTVDNSAGLTVDGSLDTYTAPSANTAKFADNSLLMVDAGNISDSTAALTATDGTLEVADSAKLYLANAQAGNTYKIVDGFTTTTDAQGWYTNTDNIILNKLLKVDGTAGDSLDVAIDKNSYVMKNIAIPNIVEAVADKQALTTEEGTEVYSTGANYVAMATSGLLTDKQSITLLNNAAQAAESTGATANAFSMATTFSETAQNHLSFMSRDLPTNNVQEKSTVKTVLPAASFADNSSDTKPVLELHMGENVNSIRQSVKADANNDDTELKAKADKGNIWARYVHEQGKVDGRKLAGTDNTANYDNKLNGITVGFDFAKKKNYEQGIAISYGFGSAEANGINQKDKYQGGGISYYGSIKNGNNNLIMDAGYYQVKHDVEGLITAKPENNILTLGVTEEYRKDVGNGGVFVPHIGLRYTYMDTPGYSGLYNGKKAFNYGLQKNHVVSLPIGVGYMHKFASHGWKYNLAADVSYIGVLGGNNADMDVSIPGLSAVDSVSYGVTDRSAVKATLGLEAENEIMKWGVNYSFKGSNNEKSHRVAAGISWKF